MARTASPKQPKQADLFRLLPSMDEMLRLPEVAALVEKEGRKVIMDAARGVLESLRTAIQSGTLDAAGIGPVLEALPQAIEREAHAVITYSLRPVINATGVILHTNLGRAPLSAAALEHIARTAGFYSNLEFDLAGGERGKRDLHARKWFARVFDSFGISYEVATVVVNNNAAAVLLALNSLADGGEVVVSRGELVEIGGGFRIPEIMSKSGARLREVGTTNRTRIADYESALNEHTRLLLRVHRSNFQMVGFTEQPSLEELVALGHKRQIPVMEDLGSGALFELGTAGIDGEPDVAHSLRSGVDVVTYSGDKLLGGPQAGMLSGRRELIARIRQNPLFRALRVDKLTYAALEATLLDYIRQDFDRIPTLKFIRLRVEQIAERAAALVASLILPGITTELVAGESLIGGGSAPQSVLPTMLIAVSCGGTSADALAARLRTNDPPIIARVEDGRVLLDLRTVFEEQDAEIAAALARASKNNKLATDLHG